jgi:PAS domain S-box-containing protein
MRTSPKRLGVVAGVLLLLAVLAANAFVVRRHLGIQVENQNWVTHTHQVLFELSQTELLISDAETGQRGFLYTGDSKYLVSYESAILRVEPHIKELAQLTSDNPHQQVRVSQLRSLFSQKRDELAQTIALHRAGRPQEAKALVISGKGLALMNSIEEVLVQMSQEETSLAETRSASYKRSIRATIASIYVASAIAALGLILLAYYILSVMALRERYARQVEEREEWFRSTLTSLGDAVIATDGQAKITFLNPVAEKLIGISRTEASGELIQNVFRIFNEATLAPVENPVKKVIEEGAVIGLANHTVLESNDGTRIPIQDSAAPIRDSQDKIVGVVMVFRDATIERRSQDLLRKTEKLAAAARLAATVAHEINNPLEAIGNLIYLSKSTAGLPQSVADNLTMAEHEVERVSHITRQTLGFYRESNDPSEIELNALVESVLKIHSNKFKSKNIVIERHYGECPTIQGRAGELKQVMANLVSNAADAVNQGGTIRVGLKCIEAASGRVIQLIVEDDGPGIPAQVKDRLFEPFFTTKKDVGTGLGLWVSKEIVDRHGGTIEVHSQVDSRSSGTAFHVLLPLAPIVPGEVAKA